MVNQFKETEAGMIPFDWNYNPLSDAIVSLETGVSVNSDDRDDAEYYVLKTSAISEGTVRLEESKAVVKRDYARVKCPIVSGSIIISRMNVPQLVGECGFVEKALPCYYLPDRLWQTVNSRADRYDYRWLNYLLNQYRFKNIIHSLATGTSNSMKNISKDRLLAIMIPRPTVDEQKVISGAIYDMELLIFNLKKLIKKRENVLKGTAQNLLCGKMRMTNRSWKKYTIGQIGDFYGGLSGKTKNDFGSGKSRYISFLNVLKNTVIDVNALEQVKIEDGELQNAVMKGDLFFNTSSETPEEVGMCAVLLEPIKNTFLNSFCFGFRLNTIEIDPLFLSYYFNSEEGRKIMHILAQGATRYNLSKEYFRKTEIEIPPYEDQKEISEMLLDMEKEIRYLNLKLRKYQMLKQGMMEELLTGKVRLI